MSRQIHPLYSILTRGIWLLYGEPFVGKSFFCAKLSRKYLELTKKPALYIYTDLNLRGTEYGEQLKNISKADWKLAENGNQLFRILHSVSLNNYSIVIIDSLSGVFDEIKERFFDLLDLRINLLISRFGTVLSRKFHKAPIPIILVAHTSALIKQKEWHGEQDRPRIPLISLINYLGILKFYEENGERYIKIVRYRNIDEDKWRGKVYNIKEIV